jgi:hypothetical protein
VADGGELDEPLGDELESLPDDVPFDEGGGGETGGSAGTLLGAAPAAPPNGPVRGRVPFCDVEFDPLMYVIAYLDSQSKQGREIYRGLTRSQVVRYCMERSMLEYFQRRLAGGEYDGLIGAFGDAMLRVARLSSRAAVTEVYDAARDSLITTLVDRGIADRTRLEEVLGVTVGAVA